VSNHDGLECLRRPLDSFVLKAPSTAEHICFVYRLAGFTLHDLQQPEVYGKFHWSQIVPILESVLLALDFLHDRAGMVHCDLKAENILFGISDNSADHLAKRIRTIRLSGKYDAKNERIIYRSLNLTDLIPIEQLGYGKVMLGDLGEAHILSGRQTHFPRSKSVLPPHVQAPEFIMGGPWNSAIDIRAFANLTYSTFKRRPLFQMDEYSETAHLAQMVAIMDQPSRDAIALAVYSGKHFAGNGKWERTGGVEVPSRSLETLFPGGAEPHCTLLIDFLKSMLKWDDRARASAGELLGHRLMT
jgi:serine/threonine-protein kinase SRPK3